VYLNRQPFHRKISGLPPDQANGHNTNQKKEFHDQCQSPAWHIGRMAQRLQASKPYSSESALATSRRKIAESAY
jgi:hypothetical protein